MYGCIYKVKKKDNSYSLLCRYRQNFNNQVPFSWNLLRCISVFLVLIFHYFPPGSLEYFLPNISPMQWFLPKIYIVTPTYCRASRYADIIRLSHTLILVKNIHWIVIEDGRPDPKMAELLVTSGVRHIYLAASRNPSTNKTLKGLDQRNKGLEWIRVNHHPRDGEGVVYFADDDNTYSLELFEEMRSTKKVSCWPVGLNVEKIVVTNGSVIGFSNIQTKYDRTFPLDMAGFAFNVRVLFDHPNLKFHSNVRNGYQETKFLEQFCTIGDLEPKADNCKKILVWHTRTSQEPILLNGLLRQGIDAKRPCHYTIQNDDSF